MMDSPSEARRSYTVVFDRNVAECLDFLHQLSSAIERKYACAEVENWRDVGATMNIRVAETAEVELIACPMHEVSFGNTMLNIAEPFSLSKLLRKRDYKSVRAAAVEVSDGLVHCGIPPETQFWSKSNPPDFENVEDWMSGTFPF